MLLTFHQWFAILICVGVVCAPQLARAQAGIGECIEAHERGQRLRQAGKLREATVVLEGCTLPACPEDMQRDCTTWRTEIGGAIPTVVFRVTDGTQDATDVTVVVDGDTVATSIDGRAVMLDPGEHLFRFDAADGRSAEMRLVILEGDKNRKITAALPALAPVPTPDRTPEPHSQEPDSLPVALWITGSVSVLGLVAFGVVGGAGLSKENDLRDSCAGRCPQDEVDEVERLYIVADIAGAVGVAALAAAIVVGIVHWVGDEETAAAASDGLMLRF